jgi:3-methyladenine DNA glycosylase AlkD
MLHPAKARVRPTPAPSATEVARDVQQTLRGLATPAGAFDAARYFRGANDLGFHNIGTEKVRGLVRDLHMARRHQWSIDEAMEVADLLIVDRFLEVKLVAVEIVARYRTAFRPTLLREWKRWLADGHASNWATTDAICGCLVGPLLVRYPRLVADVDRWSRGRSLWVRRASAVSLIAPVRKGLALDTAYAVARRLHADGEDLIQKAVGWLLREAGKVDRVRLERYLLANGPAIPRTTLRYAIERFEPGARRRLLLATRRTDGR